MASVKERLKERQQKRLTAEALKDQRQKLIAEVEDLDRRIELSKRPSWDKHRDRTLFDQWAEYQCLEPPCPAKPWLRSPAGKLQGTTGEI